MKLLKAKKNPSVVCLNCTDTLYINGSMLIIYIFLQY